MRSYSHFNYFSVDFNEAYSALYGAALSDQTEFLQHCIKHILQLYKKSKNPPKSVVLVGHSMGGLVARGVFSLPSFDASTVHTIITQATPHDHPVFVFDRHMSDYYEKVNDYWRRFGKTSLSHVTVVSTGGGFRDIQVPNLFTSLDNVVPKNRRVNSMTMSMPRVWMSTDHLCIVWCKQFVIATKRALFDAIDDKTRQISTNSNLRMRVFRHHFISNSGVKSYKQGHVKTVQLDSRFEFVLKKEFSWMFASQQGDKPRYLFIPVSMKESTRITITTNLGYNDWILGCKIDDYKNCREVTNLSNKGKIIPPGISPRKIIHLTKDDVRDFTFIVLNIPYSHSKFEVFVDRYEANERQFNVTVPGMIYSLLSKPMRIFLDSEPVIKTTKHQAVFYNLSLDGFETIRQAYKARLIPINCQSTAFDSGSFLSFVESWNQMTIFSDSHNSPDRTSKLSLKLQSLKPENKQAHLQLILHPACSYKLHIDLSWTELFGQFCRYHFYLFPSFFMASILLSLAWQLRTLNEGKVVGIKECFIQGLTPPNIFPFVMPTTSLMGFESVSNRVYSLGIPLLDFVRLSKIGLWSFTNIPLFFSIVGFPGLALTQIMLFVTKIYGKILGIFIPKDSILLVSFYQLIYRMLVLGLAVVASRYSGAISLLLTFLLFLHKVSALSLDKDEDGRRIYEINISLLLILFVMQIFTVPSLMMIVAYKQPVLNVDPTRVCALVISACLLVLALTQTKNSYSYNGWLKILIARGILFCGVISILYGMWSAYRILYFITAVFVLFAAAEVVRILTANHVLPKTEKTE
ncbi:GPI inositol-deacylase-like isoform X2 [Tubulanus polymorphus]